ncbi:MAG: tRNA 2-thiouridine(34) synthase MnmA [Magnetococcales bacterium]|nr:tRNA 2-thiouridine(34) synthase MnmA [Magnetococcales bacterium]
MTTDPPPDSPPPASRVAVAMSGGVDSSVTAALLVQQGYEVIGLTMRLWDGEEATAQQSSRSCCTTNDAEDARRVAQTLGIPFYVIDLRAAFAEQVVSPFIRAYAQGSTPNPCMICNQTIKFEQLLAVTHSLGAEFLATGHYADLRFPPGHPPQLFRGRDPNKDQSYFLASTSLTSLTHLRFPLGGLTKDETRALGRQWGLHLAGKRESQDVCFVPGGDYGGFFRRHGLEDRPGMIRDRDGNLLGRHHGIHGYTIGQRRGLGIAAPRPMYVIAVDPDHNELIVGPEEALLAENARLTHINWLVPPVFPGQTLTCLAQIRYSSPPIAASLTVTDLSSQGEIHFHVPQRAVTPGQACVFYDGDQVLGSGWIAASKNS